MSPGARRAITQIEQGKTDITVRSRKEAEEVLSRFPDLVETGGWGFDMIKSLLDNKKANTFHWDVEFGEDGYLLHHQPLNPHSTTPHLQLELKTRGTFRIFFTKE